MIEKIRSTDKISKNKESTYSIRFNASLPVTIEVFDKVGYDRYSLKIGHKDMTTRSKKPLKKGSKYWGNFSESKEGFLTISGLQEKPELLQSNSFMEVEWNELINFLTSHENSYIAYKEWILENLANAKNAKDFQLFSALLLALHEGTYHLPILMERKPTLLQWRRVKNDNLNESSIDFYIAFDNTGPIYGHLNENRKSLVVYVSFYKTAIFLKEHLEKLPFSCSVEIKQNISPIWSGDKALLDLKG